MRNESPTVTLEIPKAWEYPTLLHDRTLGTTCNGAHEALVPQPEVTVFIPCPCARCQLFREEYAPVQRFCERNAEAQLQHRRDPEAPTQRDRDAIDAIDVVAKIIVGLLFGLFLVVLFHALATHAVERMLSR